MSEGNYPCIYRTMAVVVPRVLHPVIRHRSALEDGHQTECSAVCCCDDNGSPDGVVRSHTSAREYTQIECQKHEFYNCALGEVEQRVDVEPLSELYDLVERDSPDIQA